MKFVELPKKLKEDIASLYVLKGDDSFVINSATKHISNACGNDLADFNKAIFDSENFSVNKFSESVMVMPLGVQKRFILLKNITKLNEGDKKSLGAVLNNFPNTTCVTIIYNDTWKFLKIGTIVDCGKMDFDMLSKYISIELKKSNKRISPEALKSFIELCSYNMTKISTELKKVSSYSDDIIEKDDILALVTADEEFQIFELTESLGSKDGARALKILANFLQKKEPIQVIFGMISNHFRRVAHASISGLPPAQLAEYFGVKEYAIVKAREQAKYFSKIQLKNILALLEDVDNMIKSGKMSAENAIYYLVFKILYC